MHMLIFIKYYVWNLIGFSLENIVFRASLQMIFQSQHIFKHYLGPSHLAMVCSMLNNVISNVLPAPQLHLNIHLYLLLNFEGIKKKEAFT